MSVRCSWVLARCGAVRSLRAGANAINETVDEKDVPTSVDVVLGCGLQRWKISCHLRFASIQVLGPDWRCRNS